MSKLKVKAGSADLHRRFHAAFANLVPKTIEGGTFTYARSTEDSPTAIRYVVTTGIRAFDDRVGGMPIGKATELVGLPQSGKTNMAVRTCVRAQQGHIYERVQRADGGIQLKKLDPKTYQVTCAYYDQEGSLSDFDKRMIDGQMLDAEVFSCDTVELLWATMDKMMTILDEEQDSTGIMQILVVVIDTVGSLSTKGEYLMAWGKQDFPRVPQELKTGMKVMIGRMQRENVLLMGLNHVTRRMDLRGKVAFKGWHYTAPGGMAFSYYAYHRVFFEMVQTRYCLAGRGNQDGFLVYFQTLKNRLLQPLREGRLALLFSVKDRASGKLVKEGGFKDDLSLLECLIYAKAAKIAKESGAISFRFDAFGIQTSTFGTKETVPTLEEQEDTPADAPRPRRGRNLAPAPTLDEQEGEAAPAQAPIRRSKRDPKIPNRGSWPAFYAEHQADCDALYEEVTRRALASSETLGTLADDDDDDVPTED